MINTWEESLTLILGFAGSSFSVIIKGSTKLNLEFLPPVFILAAMKTLIRHLLWMSKPKKKCSKVKEHFILDISIAISSKFEKNSNQTPPPPKLQNPQTNDTKY